MTTRPEPRTGHPYYMHDAVHGQPAAVARVLDEEAGAVRKAARSLEAARRIHLVGVGTSWHAALVGEYLLANVAGRGDARVWNSFDFVAGTPPLSSQDAVIIVTHTGRKSFSVQALEVAKAGGASTVLVTGTESEAKTELADAVVRTSPQDKSAAYTVSHTSAMTVLAMLATELGLAAARPLADELRRELRQLPALLEQTLAREGQIEKWAEVAASSERFYFVAWGVNTASVHEVALKMKETSYVVSEGFQLEQYLHGPFCATQPGVLLTLVAPNGRGRERAVDLARAANTVGARTAAIVPDGEDQLSRLVATTISLPAAADALTPILYLVPLQLFAYWVAVRLGRNPDTFRLDEPAYKAAFERYRL